MPGEVVTLPKNCRDVGPHWSAWYDLLATIGTEAPPGCEDDWFTKIVGREPTEWERGFMSAGRMYKDCPPSGSY